MLNEKYSFEYNDSLNVFEFESVGPKGIVKKVVQYTETNLHNFFNLGFGDLETDTNFVNDLVISNNNDTLKVLTTVAETLMVFTENHPEAFVMATGSTPTRTRLYRIGINTNLESINAHFYVFGLKNGKWVTFEKNATYDAYLVKRKL